MSYNSIVNTELYDQISDVAEGSWDFSELSDSAIQRISVSSGTIIYYNIIAPGFMTGVVTQTFFSMSVLLGYVNYRFDGCL